MSETSETIEFEIAEEPQGVVQKKLKKLLSNYSKEVDRLLYTKKELVRAIEEIAAQASTQTRISEVFPKEPRRRLILLTEWNKHHSWPPIGGLRHLVFYAKTNGFNKVVVKKGGRVFIDEEKFFEWEDNGGEKQC